MAGSKIANSEILPFLSKIHNADTFEFCKTIPTESVDFIMTSPPYWSMRDYRVEGQFGNEEDVSIYLNKMSSLCFDLYRILKPTGSFWLNIGDKVIDRQMMCIPWKLSGKLVSNQGWRMTNCVIWRKTNPMPGSDEKRLTSNYEFLFHFTKQKDYWSDLYSIREKHAEATIKRGKYVLNKMKDMKEGKKKCLVPRILIK